MQNKKQKQQTARSELGSTSVPQPPPADLGTPPSNTVPSNYIIESNLSFLRTGIDSLYVSLPGELTKESSIRLEELKLLAKSPDHETTTLAQLEFEDHIFEVNAKGRGVYAYVLRNNWFEIQVSKLGAELLPLMFVKISSELLTLKPLSFITEVLFRIASTLGSHDKVINLSRVDLCADFVTSYPFHTISDNDWVTRARQINNYSVSRHYSGCSIGQGGKISARLYDKTLELQIKPRDYLEDIWRECKWNGSDKVWRLEFQFRRELLKELSVPSYPDLETGLSGLWHYATKEWLRLSIPTQDTNQSRWATAPIWQELQSAPWTGTKRLLRADVHKGRLPSDKTLFENGLSGFTSYMAREGLSDYQEAIRAYFSSAIEYHNNREHFTGIDFLSYINKKLKIKQRAYNTAINVPKYDDSHPADQAVARAYRKARDGE